MLLNNSNLDGYIECDYCNARFFNRFAQANEVHLCGVCRYIPAIIENEVIDAHELLKTLTAKGLFAVLKIKEEYFA